MIHTVKGFGIINKAKVGVFLELWLRTGNGVAKAGCCHLADLIHMRSAACEIPVGMKHKLESRLQEEISITSDMQMTQPYGRKERTKEPVDESERGQ